MTYKVKMTYLGSVLNLGGIPMFARVKKSRKYQYLQIVENNKEKGKVVIVMVFPMVALFLPSIDWG